MFNIVLSALLVAAVVAEPCCTPQQWEGVSGSVVGSVTMGKPMTNEVNSEISYDFMNKMLRYTTELTVNQRPFKNTTIINYNTKEMYMVDDTMGTCTVRSIVMDMMEACIPDGAKEQGQFYYGAGVNNMLQAKAFQFMMEVNDTDTVTVEAAVTEMDCFPIGEVVFGRIGMTDILASVGFVDITPGIKDPSIFDPPSSCAQMKVQGPPVKLSKMSFVGLSVH